MYLCIYFFMYMCIYIYGHMFAHVLYYAMASCFCDLVFAFAGRNPGNAFLLVGGLLTSHPVLITMLCVAFQYLGFLCPTSEKDHSVESLRAKKPCSVGISMAFVKSWLETTSSRA